MSSNSNLMSVSNTGSWDEVALANAMMSVSLSQGQLQRRYSEDRSLTSSPMQQQCSRPLSGWGSQTTRQTCKTNLCSLSQRNVGAPLNRLPTMQMQSQQTDDYFNFDL